jgi:molecular chaperone DnaJ
MAIVARDFYLVLGVSETTDAAGIREAYSELTAQLDEDASVFGDDATLMELRREIEEAYQVLSDPVRRHQFDQLRDEPEWWCDLDEVEPLDEPPEDDRKGALRSMINRYLMQVSQQGGSQEVVELQLPFEVAALGGQARIRLPVRAACPECRGVGGSSARQCSSCLGQPEHRDTCPECHGHGWIVTVNCSQCAGRGWVGALGQSELVIPSGVSDGTLLPFPGFGSDGDEQSVRPQFIRVKVTRHPFFSRRGQDIVCQIPISEKAAREGKTITVRTIRGRRQSVVVPPQSVNGDVVRIEGEGIESEGQRGDQLIEIKVKRTRKSGGKS